MLAGDDEVYAQAGVLTTENNGVQCLCQQE